MFARQSQPRLSIIEDMLRCGDGVVDRTERELGGDVLAGEQQCAGPS
jgi:hypothetical protein